MPPIRLLAAVATWLACSSASPPPVPDGGFAADGAAAPSTGLFVPRDGSRLKVRWYETSDGDRGGAGWYDSQLGSTCEVMRAADGEWRCLPGPTQYGTYFADDRCSMPVGLVSEGACRNQKYVARYELVGCIGVLRIFPVGERLTTSTIFYRNEGGCYQGYSSLPTSVNRVGDEVPPAMFVRMRRTVEELTTPGVPLRLVVFEGEDGARGEAGWQLTGTGEDCTLERLADGRMRCVPQHGLAEFIYADAACTMRLSSHNPACGPPPAVIRDWGGCPAELKHHRPGPAVDTFFSGTGATCGPAKPQAGRAYRRVGEVLPDEIFPAVEERRVGSGRLQRRELVAPGGRAVSEGWFDSNRNEPCDVAYLDGKHRCVPASRGFELLFGDRMCTEVVASEDPWQCRGGVKYLSSVLESKSCPSQLTLFTYGAPYTSVLFQQESFANRCVPFSGPVSAGSTFVSLEAVAATEFAELKAPQP